MHGFLFTLVVKAEMVPKVQLFSHTCSKMVDLAQQYISKNFLYRFTIPINLRSVIELGVSIVTIQHVGNEDVWEIHKREDSR